MPNVGKQRNTFIAHILCLFLLIRGRRNFTNAARYGFHTEAVYRRAFAEPFDWLSFNTALATEHGGDKTIIVFDPSFLPKSRKKTVHVGTFWSGSSGKALHGLEIGCLAAVDRGRATALHLEAVQTPNTAELKERGRTLTDHYAEVIIDRKKWLERLSKYLVVDGYFAKHTFFDRILGETHLHVVTKLRNDADLRYLYEGIARERGRPRRFDGKVDWSALPHDRWETVDHNEDTRLLSALLWSPSFKRTMRVIVVQEMHDGMPKRYVVLCSTDTTLPAADIFDCYTKRFQIEFLFRDAKQFAGLTHCQARSERKLHFHSNAALSAVSIAKVAHFFDAPADTTTTYSLADVGMAYFNEFFTKFFFARLDIEPKSQKIAAALPSLLSFGLIHGR
ncbi:MAG: transposase [Acidobacteriota bacterium]